MRITFSSAVSVAADIGAIAGIASRCRYDAVELCIETDSSPFAPEICEAFVEAGLEISAIKLASNLAQLPAWIAVAEQLHSPSVIIGSESFFGRTDVASQSTVRQLLLWADTAAAAGVSILIENPAVKDSALRLWHLLDRLNHPSIGCCWNTLSAARAGDSPAVAVPLLNSRIRYVQLQDAKTVDGKFIRANLGDGELPIRKTMDRLRGIGFDRYLLVGTADDCGPGTDPWEEALASAYAVLRQWQIVPTPIPQ